MSNAPGGHRQAALFDLRPALDHVVNVASVPQRSPFRYPGGKTWLVPLIRRWLLHQGARPELFLEPFAGGGIVGLTVCAEGLACRTALVEIDDDIAAVWEVMLSDEADGLAREIGDFDLTRENVLRLIDHPGDSVRERALSTLVRNRTLHGGILAPGSGLVKLGENGKGLSSRWYPETLRRRILAISAMRDEISFEHGDGLGAMQMIAGSAGAVCFIDPPYTAGGKRAGRRLYRHNELDHRRLFDIAASLAGDFLMTYDDAPELHSMAASHGFDTLLVSMQNTHLAKMRELLIGRNLDWAR